MREDNICCDDEGGWEKWEGHVCCCNSLLVVGEEKDGRKVER